MEMQSERMSNSAKHMITNVEHCMLSVTLSALETALCNGVRKILHSCDSNSQMSSAIMEQLEIRCIAHTRRVFLVNWASMDEDQMDEGHKMDEGHIDETHMDESQSAIDASPLEMSCPSSEETSAQNRPNNTANEIPPQHSQERSPDLSEREKINIGSPVLSPESALVTIPQGVGAASDEEAVNCIPSICVPESIQQESSKQCQ